MSQDHVEVVEALVAAWNRRDLETAISLTDPDAEYINPPLALEPGTRHGHEGLANVLRKQWEGLGPDARQHIDATHVRGDTVIAAGRISRKMPGSDTPLENRIATRWTFRDGKVIRLELLGAGSTFKSALEAAGVAS